ncbi:unnamed protein product [Coffea canephora]|uniref:Uncharacterized protein n=1 Tax=Coffea canephora TaxID=49390 RepID=A0A068TWV1_COFCA|nr:unnamed protein product [Coffea canephora]
MSEKEIAALEEGNASGFPYKSNEKNYFLWDEVQPEMVEILFIFEQNASYILFCTNYFHPVSQIGELAGIAIGMTILINVLVAGPVSGASMNPARSIGPAIIMNEYKGLWIYIAGPLLGTIAGAFTYNLIRFTEKPLQELTKSSTFMKSVSRART